MLTNKALLISSTLLTSVGAGVGGYFLFHQSPTEKKTIEQLFKSSNTNKAQLTDSNKGGEGWAAKWASYIDANSEGGNPKQSDLWQLSDWGNVKTNKTTVPTSFANACGKQLTEKVEGTNDIKYQNYINWCTK